MQTAQFFPDLSRHLKAAIRQMQKRLRLLSLFRLISFLAWAAAIYFLWGTSNALLIAFVFGGLPFLFFVRKHADLKYRLNIEKAVFKLSEEEIENSDGKWKNRDGGDVFIDSQHPFSSDLNLFGRNSIYQFLNRSKSPLARERMAMWLKNELVDPAEIKGNQELIEDLAKHPEFLLRLLAHAEETGATADLLEKVKHWGASPEFDRNHWVSGFFRFGLPAIALGALFVYFFQVISGTQLLYALLVPAVFVAAKLKAHGNRFNSLISILKTAEAFRGMFALIGNTSFESEEMQKLLKQLGAHRSREGLAGLKRLVSAIESRNNVLVSILLNIFLAWDFQLAHRLVVWKKQYGSEIYQWLELANILETYASFGLYHFNHPDYHYAEISNDEGLSIIDAHHVLLGKESVPNSLSFDKEMRFSIITGANMAGKSTYLRTIGTTLLFAMRGLPVPVKSMRYKPQRIFTSMLTTDSLGDRESYFFSELKRLRSLMDRLETGSPYFVILDEILKGTNSVDKAKGSKRFMRKLLQMPAKGLIATHDLSLCELEKDFPEKVQNKRFEIEFHGDELVFNYKLDDGICQNMNASFLLKKMGLTD